MRKLWPKNSPRVAVPAVGRSQRLFASIDVSGGYWPVRSIFISLLCHASILFGMTLFAILNIQPPPRMTTRAVIIDLRETGDVTLLPTLADEYPSVNSPSQPEDRHSEEDSKRNKPTSAKELSYPGLQRIRSDVQEPTNRIQTL